jgi:hypothetical protein
MGVDWHLVRTLSLHVQYVLHLPRGAHLVIAIGLVGYIYSIDWEREVETVTKRIEEP